MTLKLNTHMIIQVLLVLAQVGNVAGGYFPKYTPLIAAGVGFIQAVVAYIGHVSTPAGNRIPPTE